MTDVGRLAGRARALVDGEEFFGDLFDAIGPDAAPVEYLRLHAYRLSPELTRAGRADPVTIADALAGLGGRGARIDVSLSRHAHGRPNTRAMAALVHRGIPARWGRGTWRQASHEKFAVVAHHDGASVFLGSLDPWVPRWDTSEHLAIDDRRFAPLIRPSHDVGVRFDTAVGGADLLAARGRELDLLDEALRDDGVRLLHKRAPDDDRLRQWMVDAIDRADRFVYVEDQFFLPGWSSEGDEPTTVLGSLHRAVQRGVEIIVVIPGASPPYMPRQFIERRSAEVVSELRQRGRAAGHRDPVSVFAVSAGGRSRTGRQVAVHIHSKVLIVDGTVAFVGSSNLTSRSLYFDDESVAMVEEPVFVADLFARLLTEHLGSDSVDLTGRDHGGPWAAAEWIRTRIVDPRR